MQMCYGYRVHVPGVILTLQASAITEERTHVHHPAE